MTAPTRTRAANGGVRNGQSKREQAEQRTRARADPRVRARSAAAERAYARKEERGKRAAGPVTERRARKGGAETVPTRSSHRSQPVRQPRAARQLQRPIATAKRLQEKVSTSRGPFVITVMAVLAVGIVGTLWLSIAAVSNSYQLRQAAAEVNELSERKETLLGQVSRMNSTPALQQRAERLGLVPGPDPAHLVVSEDGSVTVVGEPEVAKAPEPPAPKPPPKPDPAGSRQAPEPGRQPAPGPGEPGAVAAPPAGQQAEPQQPAGDGASAQTSGRP